MLDRPGEAGIPRIGSYPPIILFHQGRGASLSGRSEALCGPPWPSRGVEDGGSSSALRDDSRGPACFTTDPGGEILPSRGRGPGR